MAGVPLPEQLELIRTQLERTTPRGKYSALNAVEGLEKAWALRHLDKEIAYFRAVTAEEEAATALFHALKRRGYPGSAKLNPRNHVHKAALAPYVRAIINETRAIVPKDCRFRFTHNPSRADHGYTMIIQHTGENRLRVWHQEELLAFTAKENGEEVDFRRAVEAIASEEGTQSVADYLRELGNKRNRALYAGGSGRPRFRGHIEKYLLAMRLEIYRTLLLFVIVDLERRPQGFVQQALKGFLKILSDLKREKGLEGEA